VIRCCCSALALALLLPACDLGATLSGPKQVSVLNGAISVAAPPGYCVDPEASQAAADTVVVLIGRCTANGLVQAALVTVTIGRSASAGVMLAGPAVLGQYFASTPGRRALARDGDPAHVLVVATRADQDVLYLHLIDITAGDYWRAITGLQGRLVTVSASGAQGAPLTPEEGRRLVADTIRALKAVNAPAAG
jgi:hypothetical protein